MATPIVENKTDYSLDDDGDESFEVENISWKKIEQERLKDGYRDGLEAGEESMLQGGHDDGFRCSGHVFHLYRLCGVLKAVECYISLHSIKGEDTTSTLQEITSLETEIRHLEHEWRNRATKCRQAPTETNCTADVPAVTDNDSDNCFHTHSDLLNGFVTEAKKDSHLSDNLLCLVEYNACVCKLDRLLQHFPELKSTVG